MASASQKLDEIIRGVVESMRLTLDFKCIEEDDFGPLKQMVFDLCKAEMEASAKHSAVQAAAREETSDDFERSYEANAVNITDAAVKQSARYKAFASELRTVTNALQNSRNQDAANDDSVAGQDGHNTSERRINVDDEDGGAGQMNMPIPDIDPLTKRPLENPCRNRLCNHVYGMDSVVEALQTNTRLRCPIVGCPNKEWVRVADLVADKDLARKLYVQRAQKRTR